VQHRTTTSDTFTVGSTILVGGEVWRVVSFDDELRSCRLEPADRASFEWYDGVPPRAAGRRA
jgi:hypothetical protein